VTLSRADYLARWSQLHGGYDPAGSRLVAGWLRVAYTLARPVAAARVPADVVSLAAVVVAAVAVAACAPGARWVLVGAVAVGLCGLLDGVDGAVAVVSGQAGAWGAVLDSVVDRVVDAMLLLALWVVGAPAWVCLAAGVVAFAGEYARARAGGLGVTDITVVTVGERPARVAVTAMFLLAAGVFPAVAGAWVAAGSGLLLVLAVGSLAQLLPPLRRRLLRPRPVG
jgi:CDP-diacylglycerol--glycerol-3-phosphate 3-phosphatidyltransferase